jgi:hypothetical protein
MKAAHRRSFWRATKSWLVAAIGYLNKIHGLVTAIATFLLAIATFLLAFIALRTDTTLRDTLMANNRAWVTPAAAFLDPPVVECRGVGSDCARACFRSTNLADDDRFTSVQPSICAVGTNLFALSSTRS